MKLKFYGVQNMDQISQLKRLTHEDRFAMKVVAQVLPFRVNNYVIDELIDWDNIPEDPIYQLMFVQHGMLEKHQFKKMAALLKSNGTPSAIKTLADELRLELNPHPAGQLTANIPKLDGKFVAGVQHKYRETALIFPASGQTCLSYCTFCFRWPQFVGMNDLKFATDESNRFQTYLKKSKEVTDIILTGGDPLIMRANKLALYIEPFLKPEFNHIQTIRIGTKMLGHWPYRVLTDNDAEDILRLFEKVTQAGKHLAIMSHFSHWKELESDAAQLAIRKLQNTGAVIRTQSPILKHINDSAGVWTKMWKEQMRLGCVPYYMFVERDTGARHYFEIPLVRAMDIFHKAYRQMSGLVRTVRGPSMSTHAGKIQVDSVGMIQGEKVFQLTFLQARNPDWVKFPFFAKYDSKATWQDDLKPAFGKKKFFFEDELYATLDK